MRQNEKNNTCASSTPGNSRNASITVEALKKRKALKKSIENDILYEEFIQTLAPIEVPQEIYDVDDFADYACNTYLYPSMTEKIRSVLRVRRQKRVWRIGRGIPSTHRSVMPMSTRKWLGFVTNSSFQDHISFKRNCHKIIKTNQPNKLIFIQFYFCLVS